MNAPNHLRRVFPHAFAILLWAASIVAWAAAPNPRLVVGATEGKFAVTSDGGSAYSIPIKVSPGTNGIEPRLTLAYSSRAGKTPYGFGWNISGLTLIQRGQQNLSEDGVVRGVNFTADDALLLDGEKLIAVAERKAANGSAGKVVEYRTRTDSFTRVRAYDWSSAGPARFVAETRAGLILHFGRTANSRVAGRNGTGPVVMWLCDRVEDKFGNYMFFTYVAEAATMDYQIKEINYTANDAAKLPAYAKVVFEYETLGTPYEIRFLDGEPIRATKRLTRIVSRYEGRALRTYIPEYESEALAGQSFFFLKSLSETADEVDDAGRPNGEQLRYRPLKFSYTHSIPQWAQRPWLSDELQGLPSSGKISEGFHPLRVLKDGATYTAVVFRAIMGGKDASSAYYFDPVSGKWSPLIGKNGRSYIPPVALANQNGAISTVAWADVDGDGAEDLLVSGQSTQEDGTYLSRDGGWEKVDPIPVPIRGGSIQASGVMLIDLSAGGTVARTLVWHHHVAGTGLLREGAVQLSGSTWRTSPFVPPLPLRGDTHAIDVDRSYALDVDCDGIAELAYLHPQTAGGPVVYKAAANGWSRMPSSAVPSIGNLPAHIALQSVGKSSSNCARIMAAYRSDRQPSVRIGLIGTAAGWQADVTPPNILFSESGGSSVSQVASVSDLNADGHPDIFAYTPNRSQRYAYLNNGAGGWSLATSYAPPLALPSQPAVRERLFYPIMLGGPSRPLLMYLGSGANPTLPRIFAHGAGGGWEEIGDYRLPDALNISVFDKVDLGIRFADVNGDGYPDIVWAIRKAGAVESKAWLFNPRSSLKKWEERPEYALPEPLTTDDYLDTGVLLADVNGDGLVDILAARERHKFVAIGVPPQVEFESAAYINCSKRRTAPCVAGKGVWQKNVLPALAPPMAFVREGLGSLGVRAIDVNGDGLTDLVYSRLIAREPVDGSAQRRPKSSDTEEPPETPSPYELRSATLLNDAGVRWTPAPDYALPQPIVRQVHCPAPPGGRYFDPSQTPKTPSLSCQFFQDDETFQGQQTIDTRLEFVDVNVDRLPDVIFHYRTFVQVLKDDVWEIREQIASGALINTGHGWKSDPSYAPPDRIDPQSVAPLDPNGMQFYLNDLNADGMQDLIYVRKGNSKILLNTGSGWSTANAWYALPDDAIGSGRGDPGVRFFDVNGDGLLDIVFRRSGGANPGAGVYLNTGTGWLLGPATLNPPIAFTEDGIADVGVRPLDVNGDGLVDLIQFFGRRDGTSDRVVFVNESGRPGILEGVTDGLGLATSISYESYMAYENRPGTSRIQAKLEAKADCGEQLDRPARASSIPCDSTYPVIHALLPGYVVTRVETGGPGVERRSTAYRYAGYRLDVRAGKSLGFAFQESFDEQRNRITRNEFVQKDGLIGSIASSITLQYYRGAPVEVAKVVSSWSATRHAGLPSPDASAGFVPGYLRPHLTARSSWTRDLLGKVVSQQADEFTYDENGNTTLLATRFPDGSGSTTASEFNQENYARWNLGRPTRSVITLFAPSKPSVERRSEFEYELTAGALVRQTTLAGTSVETVGTYTMDIFGNKISSSMTDTTQNVSRTQRSDYDEKGRFIRTAYNALGQATRIEYDEASGVVRRRTDPNGVVSEVFYDGLQRARREVAGTGLVTSMRVEFVAAKDQGQFAYVSVKRIGTLPEALLFADAIGRTRRKISMGAASANAAASQCPQSIGYLQPSAEGEPVISDIRFDRLGRLVQTTVPRYCSNQGPVLSRQQAYDELDRIVTSISPDGSTTRTRYDGFETALTNASGGSTTTSKDMRGRVLSAQDALGGSTQFEYDAAGRTTATVDALGQRTEMTYDAAGNKTSTTDNIGGHWKFSATPFGEVTRQVDPRGNLIEVDYDALGRLIRRRVDSRVSTWTYDQCANGIGRLCASETRGTDSTAIAYDKYGRVESTTTTVGLDSLKISLEYDSQDRVVTKRFSTGINVLNRYDSLGNFRAVDLVDGDVTSSIVRVSEIDEMSRVRRESFGNGSERTIDISDDTGRVKAIHTTGPNATAIQQLQLDYDQLGNVTARRDASIQLDEAFSYDVLNRLTASSQDGRSVTVNYDAIGNITSKSDVGTYSYCPRGGHEKAILCGVGSGPSEQRIAYDQAGNITNLGDKALVFDADGRVRTIERKSVTQLRTDYSDFSYGTEGQMLVQETRHNTTKFRATYIAEAEILREEFTQPFFGTPERTRVRHHIVGPSGLVGFYEKTYSHYPFRFASPFYWGLLRDGPERVTELARSFSYFVKDHIGTLTAIVNGAGSITDRFLYDAWGMRREAESGYMYRKVRTGFTGHQHLDNFDLVHMQGRVYSGLIGRFLSPDVIVQFPLNTQSYSRYAYVLNNPLRFIDPGGFDLWGDIVDFFDDVAQGARDVFDAVIGKPVRWGGEQLQKAGQWLERNWRIVVIIAVAIAAPYALPAMSAIAVGAITGAAVGGLSAALYGGNIDDVLRGATMGAITGAITGGVAQGFGDSYSVGRVFAEGAAGGITSHLRGGNFSEGFNFAFAMAAVTYANQEMRRDQLERSAQMDAKKGNNLEPTGEYSEGKFGLRDKLGGSRKDFANPMDCSGGIFGGCQSGEGTIGFEKFKYKYAKGSFSDNLVESFAGPHDWMIDKTGGYWANGFGKRFGNIWGDTVYPAVMLVPAAYFAAPAFVPIQAREEMRRRCTNAYGWCM